MNTLKQKRFSLLDYLSLKAGCMYLSDLPQREMLYGIQHAVRELEPETFSLWEWNDAVAYITRKQICFESPEKAAEYLLTL